MVFERVYLDSIRDAFEKIIYDKVFHQGFGFVKVKFVVNLQESYGYLNNDYFVDLKNL